MTDYIYDPNTGEFREAGTTQPRQPRQAPPRPRPSSAGTTPSSSGNSSSSTSSDGGCCSWLIYLAIFLFFMRLCS